MRRPSGGASWGQMLAIAICPLVLTAALHGVTLRYGFYYDDYHFVHPYSAAEVLSAFHGPWDASGIETAYYRPLTIVLFAARFHFLGLNSAAYHALSLVLFAMAAAIAGFLVRRAAASTLAGVLTAGIVALHPGMPYGAVAWVTNQMHLLQMLTCLAAFAWWFRVRRRGAVWWLPLIVLQAAALLIKEDGIMLFPAIVTLHVLRKWLVEPDLPFVPLSALAAVAVTIGCVLAVRHSALEGTAHTRIPGWDQAAANVRRGLSSAFALQPARRPHQMFASWFVRLAPLAALLFWPRITRPVRFVMLAGLAIGVLFDLPFVFIIKAEQLYMVSFGAAVFLAGSLAGIVGALSPHRFWQAAVAIPLAIGLAALALVARHITRDFEPFAPGVLATDAYVQEWAAVPLELREFLAEKRASNPRTFDANPSHTLPIVAFGLHGVEIDPAGRPIRWMAQPTADLFVSGAKRLATIPLRHEIGAFREEARVRVTVDGRIVEQPVLADGNWHSVTVNLRPRDAARADGMHHIRIGLSRTWVPAAVIPSSTDTRTLGLQIGALELR